METATWLWIILAACVALAIAVFQYFYKNKEKSQLNYWLSFLRFFSVFTILLLIINPSLKKTIITVEKPQLLLAVDNSKSIESSKTGNYVKNVVEEFKNNSALNSKFNIQYYTFGNSIHLLDSLTFSESQTNIAAPFKAFEDIYNSNESAVILITDGNQTKGNNVEFLEYKNPVFPLVVGDTTNVDDIYISGLNVNKFTYVANKFPVEVFVNYEGSKAVTKQFSVVHKGKKIYTESLSFSSENSSQICSFYLTATNEGTEYYTASIEQLDNEKNTVNNAKYFSINAFNETAEILILTNVYHPDLGMLKRSIESNKQRKVSIQKISEFKGSLSNYQLVILYQPTSNFQQVVKELNTKKTNVFIITGMQTEWDFLNESQPYFFKNVVTESEAFLPVFNPNYEVFMLDDIEFSTFSPVEDYFGDVTFKVPFQTILYQKIGNIATEKPLLVTFETNANRGGILFGENSWRWRMNSYFENKTFEKFDAFFASVFQYLISNQQNKQLNVAVNPIFYANEPVIFSASYLDKNYNFDSRAKLWLNVVNTETNFSKKIPFAVSESRFVAEFSNLSEGEYTYSVSVENKPDKAFGKFKILPFEVEQQFANSNDKALKQVANNTQGTVFYQGNEKDLMSSLLNDERFKGIQKSTIQKTPLINWKWLLGLLILLLSAEWFTRKYNGMI